MSSELFSMTVENRNVPIIAYRKNNSISSPPTEARDGSVTMRVLKMTLRSLNPLTILNTLPILKVLIKVPFAPPLSIPLTLLVMIIAQVPTTTKKSNTFHASLKYSCC